MVAQRWWAAVAASGWLVSAALQAGPATVPAPAAAHTATAAPPAAAPNPVLTPVSTAEQAAREAQRANGGGRVLAVDSTPQGFRVKLIKHGDVRVVIVPAAGH